MSDEQSFSSMKLRGRLLKDCELTLECNKGNYRLYVVKEDGVFYAMAVEFVSSGMGDDFWSCPDLMVSQLFEVTAYFDGVRHLEFNRGAGDLAGYIYYPNMPGLIELLQKVREIELEICSDCDK